MGYSTHYNLSIVGKEGTKMFVRIITKLRNDLLDAHSAFDENGYSTNGLKW